MNKKVIFIILLVVVALVFLALYTFGPLSKLQTAQKINPVSAKPAATQPVNVGTKSVAFQVFHNKDMTQNYYSLSFPQDWKVVADKVGSYSLVFSSGSGTSELIDIPDNSTPELVVLSQEEPKLKKAIPNYARTDYKKISVSNNPAYQLVYTSTSNGQASQTVRTYITGPDHATVLTLTAKQGDFENEKTLFDSILNSFKWEN